MAAGAVKRSRLPGWTFAGSAVSTWVAAATGVVSNSVACLSYCCIGSSWAVLQWSSPSWPRQVFAMFGWIAASWAAAAASIILPAAGSAAESADQYASSDDAASTAAAPATAAVIAVAPATADLAAIDADAFVAQAAVYSGDTAAATSTAAPTSCSITGRPVNVAGSCG